MSYDIGVVGLGVMGRNLALNIGGRGFSVTGFDLDASKAADCAAKWSGKDGMAVAPSLAELVRTLTVPRKILIMVPAGKPVDAVLRDLRPHLAAGDVLIDGGNSFFQDTGRRGKELEESGIHYIGAGVSGGEEGALLGPALMPGGPEDAYRLVEPILTAIAARVDGEPCCGYIGRGGAGHYVKMVHNGIEYAVMQLISEAYDCMRSLAGLEVAEIQRVFAAWNQGEMSSYLIEIAAAVLDRVDPETGKPMVDVILDKAGQKGTGKWASQNALDLGVAVPTIDAALQGRILSAFKDERVAAARVLQGPVRGAGERESLVPALGGALRLAMLASYAQGFALMREASKEYGYGLDFEEIARIWRGGCIVRAKVLSEIRAAFAGNPDLPNLLVDGRFSGLVNSSLGALRSVVRAAAAGGVPCLALSASLGYIDSYRSERLPASLLQGLRDYFGAHTYQRVDKPAGESFHTDWQGEP
jgi:6-phosphogluconate dehydrogenase